MPYKSQDFNLSKCYILMILFLELIFKDLSANINMIKKMIHHQTTK